MACRRGSSQWVFRGFRIWKGGELEIQSSCWSMVVVIPKSWHLETLRSQMLLFPGGISWSCTLEISLPWAVLLCAMFFVTASVVNTVEHLPGAEGFT